MKFRVGIDVDSNRWIDWEGDSPPNLVPTALWFRPVSAINLTVTVVQEQSNYGLLKARAVGTGLTLYEIMYLGSESQRLMVVSPSTTYTLVAWIYNRKPTTQHFELAGYDYRSGSPANFQSTAPLSCPTGWTRLSLTYTTDSVQTGIILRLVRVVGVTGDSDFDVTGWGIYAGRTSVGFNSGSSGMVYENINHYMLGFTCDNGVNNDVTSLTPVDGQATITLNNVDRAWTPRNTSSPYYNKLLPKTLVEIQYAVEGTDTWEPLWTGFVDTVNVTPGRTRNQQATLQATQGLLYIDSARVIYSPRTNQTTSAIMKEILSTPALPSNRFAWQLGNSQLGTNTTFATVDSFTNIESTAYIHEIAGAGLDDKSSVRSFISDLVQSEAGMTFYDRRGQITLKTRDSLIPVGGTPVEIDLDTEANDAQYTYSATVTTTVNASYYPKRAFTGTLWASSTDDPIKVDALEMREIVVSPETTEGHKIAPLTVNAWNVSGSVYEARDSTNAIRTAEVIITVVREGQQLRLLINNTVNDVVTITATITGTGYYNTNEQKVISEDPALIVVNRGLKLAEDINLKLINDDITARDIAEFVLSLCVGKREGIVNTTYVFGRDHRDADREAKIIGIQIGDLITISDTQTGIVDEQHLVIGEQFSLMGGQFTVSHTLIPHIV